MPAFVDRTGLRFGRLTAQSPIRKRGQRLLWRCVCDCGGVADVATDKLVSGWTQSCGCFKIDQTVVSNSTHGATRSKKPTRTYLSWQGAKSRCDNPTNKRYPDYGGRGIEFCVRWKDDFSAFLEDMGEAPAGLTLERIDVNGGYNPGNCKWASRKEQADNRRRTIWADGLPLKDFSAAHGLKYKAVHYLVRYRGMSPHEAVQHIRQR